MLNKMECFFRGRTARQNKELYHLDHREGSAVFLHLDWYSEGPRDACYQRKMAAAGVALASWIASGGHYFSGFLKSRNKKGCVSKCMPVARQITTLFYRSFNTKRRVKLLRDRHPKLWLPVGYLYALGGWNKKSGPHQRGPEIVFYTVALWTLSSRNPSLRDEPHVGPETLSFVRHKYRTNLLVVIHL